MATVIVVWILYMVLFVAPYWHTSGGDFNKAFVAAMQARQTSGPRAIEIELILVLQAALIWFTYFSKSSLVRDHDKFAVFLMFCGAAVGGVILLARWFIRA